MYNLISYESNAHIQLLIHQFLELIEANEKIIHAHSIIGHPIWQIAKTLGSSRRSKHALDSGRTDSTPLNTLH